MKVLKKSFERLLLSKNVMEEASEKIYFIIRKQLLFLVETLTDSELTLAAEFTLYFQVV